MKKYIYIAVLFGLYGAGLIASDGSRTRAETGSSCFRTATQHSTNSAVGPLDLVDYRGDEDIDLFGSPARLRMHDADESDDDPSILSSLDQEVRSLSCSAQASAGTSPSTTKRRIDKSPDFAQRRERSREFAQFMSEYRDICILDNDNPDQIARVAILAAQINRFKDTNIGGMLLSDDSQHRTVAALCNDLLVKLDDCVEASFDCTE